MIGKPYSGKPNVRFDEGELEIEPMATTPALYSTRSSPSPIITVVLGCFEREIGRCRHQGVYNLLNILSIIDQYH